MKAPRWNSYDFWFGIQLVFLAGVVFALNIGLLHEIFVLLGCAVVCEVVGRNFQYSANEVEERKKPLLEQEREMVSSLKIVSIVGAFYFLLLWATITSPLKWLFQLYILAPLTLALIRRLLRLRQVRRELRHQSTLILS